MEKQSSQKHQQRSAVNEGLESIHKLLTRALKVSIEKTGSFSKDKDVSPDLHRGFLMYLRCFTSSMHAHHASEEDIGFPYFRDYLKDAPFEELTEEHKTIALDLAEIEAWLEKTGDSIPSTEDYRVLNGYLTKLNKHWGPHIEKEEKNFPIEKVTSVISKKENEKLSKDLAKHGIEHQKKLGIIPVPFMWYNLEPEDRKLFMSHFPWILKSLIVPVFARKAWKPMDPFLLN